MTRPLRIVISGLPGVGKTTLANFLASELSLPVIRVDTIERYLGRKSSDGYSIAQAMAAENLQNGTSIIADCVNPVSDSRQGWRRVAQITGAAILEVELVCSTGERSRRVQKRQHVPFHSHSTYEPWDRSPLRIDTTHLSCEDAAILIKAHMSSQQRQST